MLIIVGALLLLYGGISSKPSVRALQKVPPSSVALAAPMVAGLVILVNFAIVLALPISAILWTSLVPFVRPMRWVVLGTATIKHTGRWFRHPTISASHSTRCWFLPVPQLS
jgi:iron(III) transport system permease protein